MVEFTAAAIVTRFKTASVTATSSVFRRVASAAAMIALSGFGVTAQAQVATSTNGAKLHHIAATGGPMIAANTEEATADLRADAQFRTLFQTWKKLDATQQGVIAIPSVQPVHSLSFTSNFGIRSDPFRGTAAMHAGVDIPGPVGTPIYATADGIIAHAGRQGGYGNMVEISHGKGIATRYGHLSKILVADNARVTRGQLIALMGSTGRSTGPHLHYEVRIDGHAVNPIPFLTTADYLLAAQDRSVNAIPVSTGGPAAQD
ncbi:M23 family metallopeptidase [Sphingomonas faeni]|uniref:M23 family metallopeptidase n=1 Tax=Sphingomonas faeni TaxID=185950 RepID=UPI002413A32B|nr:M23 family metallopeptidase [Sphingomonas faeni]